jgi:glycosyltransferase involved in cell wall biosynthesis
VTERPTLRISVVIPTYNRPETLERLLIQLAAQTMPPAEFEVVVVDDGSRTAMPQVTVPYRLTVLQQQNRGAAAARHLGAETAVADVVLFIDDDMAVPPAWLSEHARLHAGDPRAVVLGWVKPPDGEALPLFERFHALYLDQLASELGLRLEADGARFHVSEAAHSVHHSDHGNVRAWMQRSYRYGRTDLRISRKHPAIRHASPWRYASIVTPLSGPFLGLALAAPRVAYPVARAVMAVATSLDAMGVERAALAGTDLVFGMQYTRGLHDESGGCRAALRDLRRYRREG